MALLVLAALAVVGAALSGSWLLVPVAAGLAVLLGAASTRITYTEVLTTRREAAADRAAQAAAYRELTEQRTEEHARYVKGIEHRIAERERALGELEHALSNAQKRAAAATRAQHASERRANDLGERLATAEERATVAQLRIAELETEIHALRVVPDSTRADWERAKSA